jgi:hypothetical protein
MPEQQVNLVHHTTKGPSKWDLTFRFFDAYGSQRMVEFSNDDLSTMFMISMASIEKLDVSCEHWTIRGTLSGVGLLKFRIQQHDLLGKKVEVNYRTDSREGFLKFVQE